MIRTTTALVFACLILISGCSPKVTVTKNPCDTESGIRYYRPKPYLLVTPAGTSTMTTSVDKNDKPVSETTNKAGGSDEAVQIQLQYLPDFSEEYAINVRPGLGNATVDITLQNGWNLTAIDQTLDSQFAENVEAVSSLVGSAASAFKGPGAPGGGQSVEKTEIQTWVVQATNVPLGYYESVIGNDASGKRQMYGWRYLGFMPYEQCPIQAYNSNCRDCNEQYVYGLVFEQGVMMFKQLGAIQQGIVNGVNQRVLVDTGQVITTTKPAAPDEAPVDEVKEDPPAKPAASAASEFDFRTSKASIPGDTPVSMIIQR